GEAELLCGLPTGVTDDDHTLRVNHDRLAESEFTDALDHWVHRVIVDAGVVLVRLDTIKRPHFDQHMSPSKAGRETEGFGRWLVGQVCGWFGRCWGWIVRSAYDASSV